MTLIAIEHQPFFDKTALPFKNFEYSCDFFYYRPEPIKYYNLEIISRNNNLQQENSPEITRIKIRGQIVEITLCKEADGFSAVNEKLNIFAFGDTEDEALEEFHSLLEHFIKHYNKIADEDLTKDAVELKKIYQKFK
jgi:hypothetical protein